MTRQPLTDPTGVVARRGGAWFIDVVLCGLAAAVPALLLADAYSLDRPSDGLELEVNDGDLGVFLRDTVIVLRPAELAVIAGTLVVAVLVLLVILPGRRGWSPGHLAADLRLVRRDGGRAGAGRALVRTIAWIIDGLPGLPLVAYASTRLTRRHQRIGDLLAGTFVVDKRAAGRAVDEPFGDDATVTDPVLESDADPVAPPEPVTEAEPATPMPEGEPDEPAPMPEPEPATEPAPALAARPEPAPARPPEGVPVDEPIWDRRHQRYVLWHSKAGRWLAHADDGWAPLERVGRGDAPRTG